MVECGRRVRELVWRKRLGVLRLHAEGVDILEVVVMASKGVRVEAVQMGWCRLASVDPSFRGG
jgi:hypothetical protein